MVHKIEVKGHPPIKQRYYPVSRVVEQALHKEVDKMLEQHIIEPCKGEWSSSVIMIKKSNGTCRFCLDLRKVNSVTKKDAYLLPHINVILSKLPMLVSFRPSM